MQLKPTAPPHAAPAFALGAGRSGRSRVRFAGVAQLVEHRFCKPKVRGSSPLASSEAGLFAKRAPGARSFDFLEGCPSGQREQAVNLPASAYEGSNPSPSTAVHCLRPGISPGAAGRSDLAGVAQLVERQPSKLNVAGSNPVSRSLVCSEGQSLSGGVHAAGASGALGVTTKRDRISRKGSQWQSSAHIAQVVERVLGKDEVTSSNLVVGSRGSSRALRSLRVCSLGAVLARSCARSELCSLGASLSRVDPNHSHHASNDLLLEVLKGRTWPRKNSYVTSRI
jgi:hypothetical protein